MAACSLHMADCSPRPSWRAGCSRCFRPIAAAAVASPRVVRRARAEDLAQLCELEELSWPSKGAKWSRRAIEGELAKESSTALVADEGGGAVAWAVGWMRPRGRLHIANLATHPRHCRRGHARALLSALLEQHRASAKEAVLQVRPSNWAALQLYSSLGFRPAGVSHRYYWRTTGEDALVMKLQMAEQQVQQMLQQE
ncbi:hypothetical protein ABPG75_007804 [Micractinium tetrahymenae]